MREIYYKLKSEFKSYQTLLFVCFIFFMGAGFAFIATRNTDKSSAISTDGFNPGNIISDAVMANYNSMTVEEIQKFLTEKNPCNNRNYNLYKQQSSAYPKISWHWEGDEKSGHFVCISEEKFGEGVEIGEGETAAEIIYAAAQEYKINPQVLIVLLEKEQGLISDTYPHSNQYRSATGYGCPDTAACDSKYYGFKNQVFRAAELFRYTLDNGSYLYPDNKKGVYVAYNPSSSCGGTEVFIENRATSALYRYTPYQPNAAALAAGSGIGDTCSAYGNRNFYLYFTKWFGSTQAKIDGEQITIPDGEYNINSATANNRSLGLNSSNAELTTLNFDDKAQRWHFEHDDSNNSYKITNVATKKVLDLDKNATIAGTNIQTWDSDDSCGQRWKLYRTKDNHITLETACASGMVVSLPANDETNIELGLFSESVNTQKWDLNTGTTLDDGLYTITSAIDPQQSLDIIGGYKNGQNIALFTLNKRVNQLWYFEYDNNTDAYLIKNPYSGKYLDLNAAIARPKQNIQLWAQSNSCAQKWKVMPNGDSYNLISTCAYGFSIDIADAIPAKSVNVQLNTTSDSDSQKWNISKIEPVLNDGSNYIIKSDMDERLVIDIDHASVLSGANVLVWANNSAPNQIWRVEYDDYLDAYSFRSTTSKTSLDLNAAIASNGQNIQVWSNNTSCAQRWRLVKEGDDLYSIRSYCDEFKTIDIYGAYTKFGTNIILWPYNGQNNQKWTFIAK